MRPLIRTHSYSSFDDDDFRTKTQRKLAKLAKSRLRRIVSSSDLQMNAPPYHENTYYSSTYNSGVRAPQSRYPDDPECMQAYNKFIAKCYKIYYRNLPSSMIHIPPEIGPDPDRLPSYDCFAAGYYGHRPALEPAYFVQPFIVTQSYSSSSSTLPFRTPRRFQYPYRSSVSGSRPETYYIGYTEWQTYQETENGLYQFGQQWDGYRWNSIHRPLYG